MALEWKLLVYFRDFRGIGYFYDRFMANGYVLWSFGHLFLHFLACCNKENLATLLHLGLSEVLLLPHQKKLLAKIFPPKK
jgi:hypothetical protein